MACSICGKSGHNARSCHSKHEQDEKDQALWVKIDNISEGEATDLIYEIMKDKNKIAPDARGTFAKANKKQLPSEIKKALQLTGDENE